MNAVFLDKRDETIEIWSGNCPVLPRRGDYVVFEDEVVWRVLSCTFLLQIMAAILLCLPEPEPWNTRPARYSQR